MKITREHLIAAGVAVTVSASVLTVGTAGHSRPTAATLRASLPVPTATVPAEPEKRLSALARASRSAVRKPIHRVIHRTIPVASSPATPIAPVAAAPSSSEGLVWPWPQLAECESGGNWHINTGNGYFGGLQFSSSTWLANGGGAYASRADLASPSAQVIVASRVQRASGWGAWPVCARKLGLY